MPTPGLAQPDMQAGGAGGTAIESGLLECRSPASVSYGFGSSRRLTCEFRPSARMGTQYYSGTFDRVGLDFGVSDQGSMIWMVLSTTPHLGLGALAGTYVGVTAGVALGPGLAANVLVAKDAAHGLALQPVSVSADSGLAIALAAASLTLAPAPSPTR
ncbi:DUF992 domain-containing protein [Aquabacter spiritensis]|uniref:Uncharacterized protein DUF992 n=1 Tax=Aquabacter spiritensis TaxID=933073 RepID=A0A4R3LRG9_9HYPH|nr:DUF992 domain-containing protein [Aquabacter spiritensis]TCT03184.1 uncharacterized protein DUF992 [Aquabacter spiritensis]